MKIGLNELSPDQVVGINKRVILDAHRRDPNSGQQHSVVRMSDLCSCIGAIFYQGAMGYMHLPLEKMAGLLLHRIAQGQFFLDGNKRTAVVASTIFLRNHGLSLRLDRKITNDLMWGFAAGVGGTPAKYGEEDAIQFIFDNVMPRA